MSTTLSYRLFKHLRHYRGHGIHSPLVYALSREVFWRSRRCDNKGELYEKLIAEGIKRRWAAEIEGMFNFFELEGYIIHQLSEDKYMQPGYFHIFPDISAYTLICQHPFTERTVACVLSVDKSRRLKHIVQQNNALTIQRRGYGIMIFDSGLPIQHFIL